jgi:hypothetical protein
VALRDDLERQAVDRLFTGPHVDIYRAMTSLRHALPCLCPSASLLFSSSSLSPSFPALRSPCALLLASSPLSNALPNLGQASPTPTFPRFPPKRLPYFRQGISYLPLIVLSTRQASPPSPIHNFAFHAGPTSFPAPSIQQPTSTAAPRLTRSSPFCC